MAIKYGQSVFQCGRYQAEGWESTCDKKEVWGEREGIAEIGPVEIMTIDASLDGPDDLWGIWTDEANAYDGSIATFAQGYSGDGEEYKYLVARGFSEEFIEDLPITKVRHRFYGQCQAAVGYMYAELRNLGGIRGRTTISRDTGQGAQWSDWVESGHPVDDARRFIPWSPLFIQASEVRIYGVWGKGDPVNMKVYAVQYEVTYAEGWNRRESTGETWTQVKPS